MCRRLERAFHRLRADAAVGVDGVSKEDYGQELEANLVELQQAAEGEAVPASAVATSATSPREADGRGR